MAGCTECDRLRAENDALCSENATLKENCAQLKTRSANVNKLIRLYNEMEQDLKKTKDELKAATSQDSSTAILEEKTQSLNALNSELNALQTKNLLLSKDLEEARKKLGLTEIELQKSKSSYNSLNVLKTQLQHQVVELQESSTSKNVVDKLKKENEKLRNELELRENNIKSIQSQFDITKSKHESESDALRSEISSLRDQLEKISRLNAQSEECQHALPLAQNTHDLYERKVGELEKELSELSGRNQELSAITEKKTLVDSIDSSQNQTSVLSEQPYDILGNGEPSSSNNISKPLQGLSETNSHQQLEVIKAEHQRLRRENAQLSAAERRHIADIGNLDDSLKRVTHELKSFEQKYKNDLKILNEKLQLKNSEIEILKAENEQIKSTETTQNTHANWEQQLLFHQDEVTQLKKAKTSLQELVTDQQITIIDLKAKLRDSFTPNMQTSTLARPLSERAISPVSFSPFSKSTKVDDIRSQQPQQSNNAQSIQGSSSRSSIGKPTHAEFALHEFPSSSAKVDIRNRSPTYSDVSSSNTGEQNLQQMRSGALSKNESSITGSKRKAEGEPLSVSTSKSKKSKKPTPQLGDSADYPSALRSAFTKFLSPPRSLRTSVKPYYEYAHEKVDILLTSLQCYVEELSNPDNDKDVFTVNVHNYKSKKFGNGNSGAKEVLNYLDERERSLVVCMWMMMAVWPESPMSKKVPRWLHRKILETLSDGNTHFSILSRYSRVFGTLSRMTGDTSPLRVLLYDLLRENRILEGCFAYPLETGTNLLHTKVSELERLTVALSWLKFVSPDCFGSEAVGNRSNLSHAIRICIAWMMKYYELAANGLSIAELKTKVDLLRQYCSASDTPEVTSAESLKQFTIHLVSQFFDLKQSSTDSTSTQVPRDRIFDYIKSIELLGHCLGRDFCIELCLNHILSHESMKHDEHVIELLASLLRPPASDVPSCIPFNSDKTPSDEESKCFDELIRICQSSIPHMSFNRSLSLMSAITSFSNSTISTQSSQSSAQDLSLSTLRPILMDWYGSLNEIQRKQVPEFVQRCMRI